MRFSPKCSCCGTPTGFCSDGSLPAADLLLSVVQAGTTHETFTLTYTPGVDPLNTNNPSAPQNWVYIDGTTGNRWYVSCIDPILGFGTVGLDFYSAENLFTLSNSCCMSSYTNDCSFNCVSFPSGTCFNNLDIVSFTASPLLGHWKDNVALGATNCYYQFGYPTSDGVNKYEFVLTVL